MDIAKAFESLLDSIEKAVMKRAGLVQRTITVTNKQGKTFQKKVWVKVGKVAKEKPTPKPKQQAKSLSPEQQAMADRAWDLITTGDEQNITMAEKIASGQPFLKKEIQKRKEKFLNDLKGLISSTDFYEVMEYERIGAKGWSSPTAIKIDTIPDAVVSMPKLKALDLDKHNISVIPKFIGKLHRLWRLDLVGNEVTDVPEEIGNMQNLKELKLKDNKIEKLPESIGKLKKLEMLELGGNQLKEIPETIGGLENLEKLDLDGNQLNTLPESIGDLQKLKRLSLRNNQFKTIPSGIEKLVLLEKLDLMGNSIPPEEKARIKKILPKCWITT